MSSLVADLVEHGICTSLPPMDVAPIVAHLSAREEHPGHVRVYPHEGASTSCYDMQALLSAPGFFRYATGLAEPMAEYLGVDTPLLYSVNAFWARPGGADLINLQTMHADGDDVNFAAMFVYGTDVLTDDDGAHLYTRRNGMIATVRGPAGTVFVEDPRRAHMGINPKTRPRLLMWARWGVSNPPASYGWDQLNPVPREQVADYPDDPWLRECVRLVAR